ncbi:MAG: hypothetical protein ACI3XD_06800 [Oscillospiraceae bacterium]|nr:hypothetical protein [Clostridiales bacterium]
MNGDDVGLRQQRVKIDEHSGAVYAKTWDEVLRVVDDGAPKKVVIYPNAECQVLDNSKEFYH